MTVLCLQFIVYYKLYIVSCTIVGMTKCVIITNVKLFGAHLEGLNH